MNKDTSITKGIKNTHLSKIQKAEIDVWDNRVVLSIFPNGSWGKQSFEEYEKRIFQAGDYQSAMRYLDTLGIPTIAPSNDTYSLIGRIKLALKKHK